MKPTKLLQEIRKMRFEEAYEGWNAGRLTQAEAARILGVCERSFRRYIWRYEEEGLKGLIDRRLEQASNRQAPVYETMARCASRPCTWHWASSWMARRSCWASGSPRPKARSSDETTSHSTGLPNNVSQVAGYGCKW